MTKPMQIATHIHQRGFHVIDDFLNHEDYLALSASIQTLYSKGAFEPAKIGQNQNKTLNTDIRNDHIFWLDKQDGNPAVNAYFTELDNLCSALNQSLFLGLIDYEAHFAVYQPNNFYKKHVDQFTAARNRRISCVYYLNDSWQPEFGGELKLYDQHDQLLTTITPLGNRFVCFNSDIPHEVCTAYKTRYSIAAWLKVRPMALVL